MVKSYLRYDSGAVFGSIVSEGRTTLETSEEDVKTHSKRVGKIWQHTRNEWRTCENTLETSAEDIVPFLGVCQVKWDKTGKYAICAANEAVGTCSPLVSSVNLIFYTRFECNLNLLHSFRVYFFFSHLECQKSRVCSTSFAKKLHSKRV